MCHSFLLINSNSSSNHKCPSQECLPIPPPPTISNLPANSIKRLLLLRWLFLPSLSLSTRCHHPLISRKGTTICKHLLHSLLIKHIPRNNSQECTILSIFPTTNLLVWAWPLQLDM